MPRLHHLPGSCCFLCGLSSKQTKHDGGREVFTARLTQRRNWNFTQPHCRGNWITLLVAGLEECITNALRWRAEWRRGRRREQLGRVRLHPLTPPPQNPQTDTSWVCLGSLPDGRTMAFLLLCLLSAKQLHDWRPGDTQELNLTRQLRPPFKSAPV